MIRRRFVIWMLLAFIFFVALDIMLLFTGIFFKPVMDIAKILAYLVFFYLGLLIVLYIRGVIRKKNVKILKSIKENADIIQTIGINITILFLVLLFINSKSSFLFISTKALTSLLIVVCLLDGLSIVLFMDKKGAINLDEIFRNNKRKNWKKGRNFSKKKGKKKVSRFESISRLNYRRYKKYKRYKSADGKWKKWIGYSFLIILIFIMILYLNLNFLSFLDVVKEHFMPYLIILIIFLGITLILLPKSDNSEKKKPGILDHVFILTLGIIGGFLVYYKIADIGKNSIIISLVSTIIIFIIGYLIIFDKDKN